MLQVLRLHVCHAFCVKLITLVDVARASITYRDAENPLTPMTRYPSLLVLSVQSKVTSHLHVLKTNRRVYIRMVAAVSFAAKLLTLLRIVP
jgi:hypothetical protein